MENSQIKNNTENKTLELLAPAKCFLCEFLGKENNFPLICIKPWKRLRDRIALSYLKKEMIDSVTSIQMSP